jgi:alpha-N-arabinofuranosidase
VNPGTVAEALYDVLFYHTAVRLAPFVEMVTHSATVNHGGGLRKERERVYANPCYYAQAAFHEFAGATPVTTSLEAPAQKLPLVLPDLRNHTAETAIKTVDALAGVTPEGDLLISIVHRAARGTTRLIVDVEQFPAGKFARVRRLAGQLPWDANTLDDPNRIHPVDSVIELQRSGGTCLEVELPPYSVLRVRIPRAQASQGRG